MGAGALVSQQVANALRGGNVREAERLLRFRLIKAPGDVDAIVSLADLLAKNGHLADATDLLHRALALKPDAHALHVRLCGLHQQQWHHDTALSLLQQLPVHVRELLDLRANEAALLGALGRRDEEIALYRALTRKEPKNATLWTNLGVALGHAGNFEEGVKALRRAIRLKPSFGAPWWNLANMKRYIFQRSDVWAMEAALRQKPAHSDATHFHFALGRAYENCRDYRRSFEHYAEGNRLRAESLKAKDRSRTGHVDSAISTFTSELFERNNGAGARSDAPIFVVGLKRSGSTLLEQILASHPEIEGAGELPTMQHLWMEIGNRAGGKDGDPFQAIAEMDPRDFDAIGEEYLARTHVFRSPGRLRFVDKLPVNWTNVGLIRLALPNAKIIDARRHPMACCFSNFKQLYLGGAVTYSLQSMGVAYQDYLRLMHHFDATQPGAVLHVLNERLIDDLEGEVRRMLDFIGLPFDAACLEFHKNKRLVRTPSAEQVRRPINREGVDLWRNYQPWLGPLEAALGPALDHWER